MNILISILLILVGIIVLFLIIGLFVKKDYSVRREVIINKPKTLVFSYIKFLKNQDSYSVWAKIDPDMKKEYRGSDGKPGFVSAWDSQNKKAGKGEQEILRIAEGEKIDYVIRFIKPFESTNYVTMSTTSISENQTKVYWEFSAKMNYPMNLMLLFMNMEKLIGTDLQTGLQNLRELLEK
jgi:hypothetical protein